MLCSKGLQACTGAAGACWAHPSCLLAGAILGGLNLGVIQGTFRLQLRRLPILPLICEYSCQAMRRMAQRLLSSMQVAFILQTRSPPILPPICELFGQEPDVLRGRPLHAGQRAQPGVLEVSCMESRAFGSAVNARMVLYGSRTSRCILGGGCKQAVLG